MTESMDDYHSGESPFLTVAEVAEHLRTSKMSVYRMIHSEALPSTRIGRLYRVRESDLAAFVGRSRYTS